MALSLDDSPDLMLLDASVQGTSHRPSIEQKLDDLMDLGYYVLLRHHTWRKRRVGIRTHDIELIRKPFNKAILLRLLATEDCWFEDERGRRCDITLRTLLGFAYLRLRAAVVSRRGRNALLRRIAQIKRQPAPGKQYGCGKPLYLRTDLIFGLQSGGSVTHIAGVLNELARRPDRVQFVTTDNIPTVADDIPTRIVRPDTRLWDAPESNAVLMNLPLTQELLETLADLPPKFIYHRYSVNSLVGLLLAETLCVPFVLEYNGSEVWINRHWGKVLNDEGMALQIEQLNIERADLVVVVSQALAEELCARGVPQQRILVNPNGVDPAMYRPDLEADGVRRRHDIGDQTVIGFIGTFGPWHGAAVLVDAFARVLEIRPALAGEVRLMLIGDGQQMTAVRDAVGSNNLDESVILTGRIAQHDGPQHLAACDILVSPHVCNPDGSAFFGSPTKLFEYMAMGRPIVASDLDQIGDVLSDGFNALLVTPGDSDALAHALLRLIDDPTLATSLATNARNTALERYTWARHTDRILARLQEIVDGAV